MISPVDPSGKKFLILMIAAGLVMIVVAGAIFISLPGVKNRGTTQGPVNNNPQSPVTLSGPNLPVSPVPVTTGLSAGVSPQPASPALTGTPAPGVSPAGTVLKPFTLAVSPASASGRPGETLSYTVTIEGGEGQTEPIYFTLQASALLFTQTYDLGYEQPPFPKTSVYQFTIPESVPSGITINGVLSATGAGQTRQQRLTLEVL